jgi:hypothetical protein
VSENLHFFKEQLTLDSGLQSEIVRVITCICKNNRYLLMSLDIIQGLVDHFMVLASKTRDIQYKLFKIIKSDIERYIRFLSILCTLDNVGLPENQV